MRRWRRMTALGGIRAPRVRGWTRLVNGLRPDHNPLRRPVDRLESMAVFLLVAVFLIATPLIALGVGRWAWDGGAATARAEQAAWHRVSAVVLEGVPKPQNDPYGSVYLTQVPVRWIAAGASHTGRVTTAAGVRTGATVTVWTDPSGAITNPPLGQAQIEHQAFFAGLIAVLGFSLLLGISALVIRRILQRRRMAAWDAEWGATGPLWSNYR
jgi:hypothetical protein